MVTCRLACAGWCKELVVLVLSLGLVRVDSMSLFDGHSRSLVPAKRSFDSPGGYASNECNNFLHKPRSLTVGGGIVKKIEGLRPEGCQEACLDTHQFICTAAQIQLPTACFITGYRLRDYYYSTHYRRVCEHGPACFEAAPGVTAGFSQSLPVPWYYHGHEALIPLFCMSNCERMDACVGFDLQTSDSQPVCQFQDYNIIHGTSFELFLRRC